MNREKGKLCFDLSFYGSSNYDRIREHWENKFVSLTDEKVVQPFLLLRICTVSYSFQPFLVLWLTVNITEIPTLKGPTEVFLLYSFNNLNSYYYILKKYGDFFLGSNSGRFLAYCLKKVYLSILLTRSRHMLKK